MFWFKVSLPVGFCLKFWRFKYLCHWNAIAMLILDSSDICGREINSLHEKTAYTHALKNHESTTGSFNHCLKLCINIFCSDTLRRLWEEEDSGDVRFCLSLFLIINILGVCSWKNLWEITSISFVLPAFSYSQVILIIDLDTASGWSCDRSGERAELKSLKKKACDERAAFCVANVGPRLNVILCGTFVRLWAWIVRAMNCSARTWLKLVALG